MGSEAAMADANGVFVAVWMASRAAWCGKRVVGGDVAEIWAVLGGSDSWDIGIGRADSGQVL